jgi:hypothetical protein
LKWINAVESNVYEDIIDDYGVQYYSRTLNGFQLDLPSGVEFENVEPVLFVNGIGYNKKDVRAHREYRSFWYEDSKICVYPAFAQTDTEYESGEGEITFTSSTIVTTGDSFTFASGDVVTISGCTVNTDNNKTATILSVDTDTLTFASDTFTAGEETAAITIQKASVKLIYKSTITEKEIGDMATDELLIPAKFRDIYDYYLMYKIAYLQKEYQEASNHMALYTSRLSDYEQWYDDHKPARPDSQIQAPEVDDLYASNSVDFDNC